MSRLAIFSFMLLLALSAPLAWAGRAHITPLELDEAMATGTARTDPAYPYDVFVASDHRLLRVNTRTGAIISLGNEEFPTQWEDVQISDFRLAPVVNQVVALATYREGDGDLDRSGKALLSADLNGAAWNLIVRPDRFLTHGAAPEIVNFIILEDKVYVHGQGAEGQHRFFRASLNEPYLQFDFNHSVDLATSSAAFDVSISTTTHPEYIVIRYKLRMPGTWQTKTSLYKLAGEDGPTYFRDTFYADNSKLIMLPSNYGISGVHSYNYSTEERFNFFVRDQQVHLRSPSVDSRYQFVFGTTNYSVGNTRYGLYRFPVSGGEGFQMFSADLNCREDSAFALSPQDTRLAYSCGRWIFVNHDYTRIAAEHTLAGIAEPGEEPEKIEWIPDGSGLVVKTREYRYATPFQPGELASFYLMIFHTNTTVLLAREEVSSWTGNPSLLAVMDPRSRTVAIAHLTSTNGGPFLGSELQVHSLLNPGDKAVIPVENLRQFGYTPGGDLWFIGEQP